MLEKDENNRQWYLAVRALKGDLSASEQEKWKELLRNDTNLRADFEQVKVYWEQFDKLPYSYIDTDKDWQKVAKKINKRRNYAVIWKYAAVLLLLAVASFMLMQSSGWFSFEFRETITVIEAPIGSQTYVTLPDSSVIWLNAGSKISFNNNFGLSNRSIMLHGEAFFDVEKSEVPFNVITPHYDIAVLGTTFNVRAYDDDQKQVTTLVHGSLKISNIRTGNGIKAALLKPGQRLTLIKHEDLSRQMVEMEGGIDVAAETAWKDGWLSVRSESLEAFATKLERLYDITIHFEDDELRNYRYTGKIRQLSLEQVLKALALTSPIEFDIKEKQVTVKINERTRSKYNTLENH
ncbi:DUF4974 domain-containing protein [Fulvivirga ulvae]|uniref:FecR family protein n=1 Tax=Fulvivirga ulvae TaxID=2904245 RepID=UPI001F32AD3E|nr:FecR domain-containing protein [Fulvivirga ulvae]UII35023.1 DUF4974 domain-containing protein [Fulvivirga ulvae]